LSPHLEIYRWQMGNSLSILHRITGVALALGLVALAYWLVSLAGGEASYGTAMHVFTNPLGWLFLLIWTFSFLYHLLNGVRHLMWDAGYGFERNQRHISGWAAVLGAVFFTVCVAVVVWHGAGR
jgi:succinate dehydrogenase / fumarate reductase cytochrome b subunit